MTQLALSDDLMEITAEINVYKQQAGQAVFEIGRRLKHVKEKDLVHGQWLAWLESIDMTRQTATRFIQAYEQFGNGTTSYHLPAGKIFEMLSLPESVDRQQFLEQTHTIPSTGEQKTGYEMTIRELREVKKALKEAESRAAHYEKLWNQTKNQPPQIVTKIVEKVPDDYQELREQARQAQELSTENIQLKRTIMEQRDMMIQQEKTDHALRELKKSLTELLRSISMHHETAVFYYNQLGGHREAHIAVTNFLNQFSELCARQFDEWKSLTTIKVVK